MRAVGAVHRVTRKSASDVVVESEIELMANGRAPFAWDFPVSFARDIQVTLDGKRLPVSIEPGGARGSVAIPEAGRHRLQIRRSAATESTTKGWKSSVFPSTRCRSARVVVEPASGRPARRRADRAGWQRSSSPTTR